MSGARAVIPRSVNSNFLGAIPDVPLARAGGKSIPGLKGTRRTRQLDRRPWIRLSGRN